MKSGIRIIQALALMSVLAALFAPAGAAEVAGVKLDDTVRVANQELKLNGAGVRYKAIFKVYVVGVYLTEKKSTVPEVLAAPGAKRIIVVPLRNISNEELGRAFISGIQQNSDRAERMKFVNQLQKFGEMYASIPEAKKGDVMTLDWIPGSGTLVSFNGKQISDILPDASFYSAILKIWLGDKAVDANLKPLLLGEKG